MLTPLTSLIIVLAVSGVVCGAFAAWLASEKGRSSERWFILGLVFSYAALIALVGAPPLQVFVDAGDSNEKGPERREGGMRLCPRCGALNSKTDLSCSGCDYRLQ